MAVEKAKHHADKIKGNNDSARLSDIARDDVISAKILELRNALGISALSHLLASLMSEGAAARQPVELIPIQDQFTAAADSLSKATKALANDEIRQIGAQLLGLGQGADGIFALRSSELKTAIRANVTIDQGAAIQRRLEAAVSALGFETVVGMKDGSTELISDLNRNRTLLIIVALVSLLAAAGIGTFYVQRLIIRRLTSIGNAMRRLSEGEVEVKVAVVGDGDEIGQMVRSLEVFRASEIERRTLADRDRIEQAAQHRRTEAIEAMIREFRARITTIIASVIRNLSSMRATAQVLSGIAHDAKQQVQAVSASSAIASSNMQSVAAATEELGCSINQISQQVTQANTVVEQAAVITQGANQQIARLSQGANQIGTVVKAIRDVADQTNLLALNATIEAARAGEAGRGFSVVASEVKALASQTARATEEISAQIGEIRRSTIEAVEAIRSISDVVRSVREFAAQIASAVQEQNASTHEIGLNVEATANAVKDHTDSLATVTDVIEETNRSATEVLNASNELSAQTGELEESVDRFLRQVAAA
jgi:methyl-accepting chemotaxis protein